MITTQALINYFQAALDSKWGYIYGERHTLWSAEKQAAYVNKYSGDPDRQNSCKYGGKWAGHIVTDCSGLFADAFEKLGGKIAHGSNTMWRDYCTDKGELKGGKRTDGKELLPGTAVFTGSSWNQHNHVGLYVGNGWVIEAQGTQNGVTRTKITNSKWTYWGELKGVQYGADPQPEPEPAPAGEKPTLRRGDKGAYVTLLQKELMSKGYSCGPQGADGDFGQNTEKAVRAFQSEHNGPDGRPLTVDGVAGKNTWWALESAPERITYTVTIRNLTAEQKDKLKKEYPAATVAPED